MRPWLFKGIVKKKLLKLAVVFTLVFLVCGTWIHIQSSLQSSPKQCRTDLLRRSPLSGNSSEIFGGRSKDYGQWFSQTSPLHLHVYSAFYDNRTSLHSDKQIAIIAVVDKRWVRNSQLWCRVHYGGGDDERDDSDEIVVEAMLVASGAGETVDRDLVLIEHIIVCPLRSDSSCPPSSVSLAWGDRGSGESTSFRVPVELSQQRYNGHRRHDMAVCVSTSYGDLDPRRLIEWIEMQAILGVNFVVMYNHSISSRTAVARVLDYYANNHQRFPLGSSGIRLEVRQSHDFLAASGKASRSVYLHMSPSINDCMYRYSGSVRYFAVIDLDEIIIPRTDHHSLPDLLAFLTTSSSSSSSSSAAGRKRRVGSFVFRNAYFFLDLPKLVSDDDIGDSKRRSTAGAEDEAEFSIYLNHQRRMHPSAVGYSVKSIVDSDACIAMHNHYCWNFAPSFLWEHQDNNIGGVVSVPVSVALMHHYKRCHFDKYLDNPGVCKSLMRRVVFDDVMKKYERRLADILAERYEMLNNITIDW